MAVYLYLKIYICIEIYKRYVFVFDLAELYCI